MSIIARLYDSRSQARSAYEALLAAGTPRRFTEIVESPDDTEVGTMALIGASAKAGRLLGEYSDFYLSRMQPGQSLVVVDTELGMSVTAIDILESHGALDITHETPAMKEAYVSFSEKAAPLSSMFGWSVLSPKPETSSSFWGFPELSHGLSFFGRFFPPLASSSFTMFPVRGGLPSRNPAPLSSMFGMPLLNGKSGSQLTSSFGMPLLSSSGPATSTFGLPLLSRRRWFY
jgi:hypothetical protein